MLDLDGFVEFWTFLGGVDDGLFDGVDLPGGVVVGLGLDGGLEGASGQFPPLLFYLILLFPDFVLALLFEVLPGLP